MVRIHVMFALIIFKIFNGCQVSSYISCATLSLTQENCISIDLDRWHLIMLFAIPTAVA